MRILLIGHEVRTVRQERWDGLQNGNLLSAAEAAGFSIFVTGDRNLEHQQNYGDRKLGFIVLGAVSNRLEDVLPLVGRALEAIERVRAG